MLAKDHWYRLVTEHKIIVMVRKRKREKGKKDSKEARHNSYFLNWRHAVVNRSKLKFEH